MPDYCKGNSSSIVSDYADSASEKGKLLMQHQLF
jgi:hypothetical protein